jgi:hypothetical protein
MRSSVHRSAGRHTRGRHIGRSIASRSTMTWALCAIVAVVAAVAAAIAGAGTGSGAALTAADTAAAPQAAGLLDKILARPSGLYDSVTGAAFTPRGTDFVRLTKAPDGSVYHSTFEPGQYTSANAQAVLNNMKTSSGYNAVRVFIDPGEFTTPSHGISTSVSSTTPIKAAYIANVADFIRRAAADGIYTIPVLSDIPANTYYYKTAGSPAGNIKGNNVLYLDPRYVAAKEEYLRQFVSALAGLLGSQAADSDVLAYESDNEVYFDASQPPFSTMSGTLTSLDGVTYNMSQPAQRQQAADANLVAYSRDMKNALVQADPGALLMMGFFTNKAVGKPGFNGFTTYCSTNCKPGTDYRVPGRAASVSIYGTVDILDIHVYPTSSSYSLTTDLNSIEYSLFKKPYIIGEFGAIKSVYGNNITTAAYAMKNLQIASCGLHAKGWLFWTWDTDTMTSLATQNLFYSLADSRGAINGQLAPVARPNPCS